MYRAKSWVKPCPSHVICSELKNADGSTFCKQLPLENPFPVAGGAAPAVGAAAGGGGGKKGGCKIQTNF